MEAFDQPSCAASYPTPTPSPSNFPLDPVHNDALVYLAIAVATFAAVPSLLWLRDRRRRSRERRRNRVVVESIRAKMDASKALEALSAPAPVPTPEPSGVDVPEDRDSSDIKDKKKRTKDRRKRNTDTRPRRGKKPLTSSTASPQERDLQHTDYTPRAPDQSCFSSPYMPDIASPMPLSLISASFASPSPSPTRSESLSRTGHSRSPASASSTTAPLTPSSLPPSHPSHPIVKADKAETWALHLPHDDPAWDWDGQSSTYSSGSRAPSASSCVKPAQRDGLPSPTSPSSPLIPSVPSLVFPSLNTHPPPGASLPTQIAGLKGALEASRTREDTHRRDAARWSKECDLIKWRWNEASDLWRRREAELQAQIHHLMHQVHTLTHTMQTASLSSPVAPLSFAPGQPPFPLTMPFPSLHHPLSPFLNGGVHPFHSSPTPHTNEGDAVHEGLAEAILKRPGSIRPPATPAPRSHSAVTPEAGERGTEIAEPVVEFEFPTLLERRVASPLENTVNIDGVEIFS
ncbi:hypothetical protein JB92DRAFT_3096613 [Gautieria morchelliformis]|nr:hypothetical protein JB92DRAFT_3096613 [Gautieria morchelliformis]